MFDATAKGSSNSIDDMSRESLSGGMKQPAQDPEDYRPLLGQSLEKPKPQHGPSSHVLAALVYGEQHLITSWTVGEKA